jgi:hypothetical protein
VISKDKTELKYNKDMNILRFQTVAKRLRDLMLSEDFAKAEISNYGLQSFVVNFPNNIRILVNLNKSYSTHYNLYPGSVHYTVLNEDLDTIERGHTSDCMRITIQFAYALWKMFNSRRSLTQLEGFIWRDLEKWAHHINKGFEIIPLTHNRDIIERLK